MNGLETSQDASVSQSLNEVATDVNALSDGGIVATDTSTEAGTDVKQQQPNDIAIQKMERRIDKVTGQHRQTQAQLNQALQIIEQMKGAMPQPKEVTRADLPPGAEGDALWAQHKGRHGALEVLNQRDQAVQKQHAEAMEAQRVQQEQSRKISEFQARAKEVPGLLERMQNSTIELPESVSDSILESHVGAHIAKHFLDNPSEAERIGSLTEKQQDRELLKLELQLEMAAKSRTAPQPTAGAASRGTGAVKATMQSMTMQQTQEYFQKHGKFPFST